MSTVGPSQPHFIIVAAESESPMAGANARRTAPQAESDKPKGNRPVYNVRVKQSPDSEFFHTIGAAWPFEKGDGLVVKLHLIPTNWDGTFIMVAPKADE